MPTGAPCQSAATRTAVRAVCDRCEELEAENANLRRLIGDVRNDVQLGLIRGALKATPLQAKLLLILYRTRGTVGRERLGTALYSDRPDGGPDNNIINVAVSQIRRKFGDGFIGTVWGTGYYLTDVGRTRIDQSLLANGVALAA